MNIFEAIIQRRSIRAWTNESVKDEDIKSILEAGRWSPSPLNSQPWHFIVVKNKKTIEILSKDAKEGSFLKFAPIIIVVTSEKKIVSESDQKNSNRLNLINWLEKHNQYHLSAACALQNMWLAALNLGLGACWVTLDKNSSQKLLKIPKEKEVIGCLALGHTLGNPLPHKDSDRKPLSEIVSYEKY